ncbi:MAG: dephospho-CoA kinase [bacterium]|jgi:dephospho-CoA kinase|nr:dephospho-CoA kinase [Bacillota bacterium]
MSRNKAPVIVLTGGIASGKSAVANMLADQGAKVISADELAREVVKQGTPAWGEIVGAFGRSVLTSDGGLNRQRLGTLVFADSEARRCLEKITHPRIWALLDERLRMARESASLVVAEIPLYFESDRRIAEAEVWVVYVDQETQVKRLMERDALTGTEARERLRSQLPLRSKCNWADRVIDNTGSKQETLAQVKEAVAAVVAAWAEKEDRD